MTETKLNHGYILRVHDFEGQTRYFGPFPSIIQAIVAFKYATKLDPKIDLRPNSKVFRPVLGHKYKVEFSKNGIVSVSVVTLETELQLANLKNPKD